MKLSRNVLVGSLATAGMVLGAVAPALTAQAATTSGTVGTDGSITPTTDLEKGVDAGQLGKGNLAIAYDNGKEGDDAVTGHATAKSNAQVQVVSGILLLDQVPDFNFGAAAENSTKGLVDNTKTASNYESDATDGNGGTLQVIESRSATPGFTLTASVGNFMTPVDATTGKGAALTTGNKGADFTLHLAASPLTVDGKAFSDGNVQKTTTAANILSDGTSSAPVMNFVGGTYETGTYAAKFDTSDLAQLTVGNTGADKTTPSVQSLHSTITWDLNAAAVKA